MMFLDSLLVIIKTIKFLAFDRPLYRYKTRVRKPRAQFPPILKEALCCLERDGFVVIPSYISPEECRAILDQCLVQIEQSDIRLNKVDTQNGSVRRYLGIDELISAPEFFGEIIDELARCYLGGRGVRYQSMFEHKIHSFADEAPAEEPHFDSWTKRFKAFLYLEDVGHDDGPFVVFSGGKYLNSAWRIVKELEYVLAGKLGAHGVLTKHELSNVLSAGDVVEIPVVGSQGTLILVDTRLIHRGTKVGVGRERRMLGSYYDLR